MKTFKITKRFMAIVAIVLVSTVSAMAQNVRKHVVERGETLASIASKYAVSKEDIVKLNPDAAQFVYVGMGLTIPEAEKKDVNDNVSASDNNKQKNAIPHEGANETQNAKLSSYTDEFTRFKVRIMAGLSMNKWTGKDIENKNETAQGITNTRDITNIVGFNLGMYGDYYLNKSLFISSGIMFNAKGYKSKEVITTGEIWNDDYNFDSYYDTKMTTYNIDVPIMIGTMINFTQETGLYIKCGPYLSYTLSGKKKVTGKEIEYEDIHSSATLNFKNEVKIGEKELTDYQRFSYGLMGSIGLKLGRCYLECSYQQGLSKLIKDNKLYDRSVFVFIGCEL